MAMIGMLLLLSYPDVQVEAVVPLRDLLWLMARMLPDPEMGERMKPHHQQVCLASKKEE